MKTAAVTAAAAADDYDDGESVCNVIGPHLEHLLLINMGQSSKTTLVFQLRSSSSSSSSSSHYHVFLLRVCHTLQTGVSLQKTYYKHKWRRGVAVERRIRDREVAGSSLGRALGVKTLGKFLTPMVSP